MVDRTETKEMVENTEQNQYRGSTLYGCEAVKRRAQTVMQTDPKEANQSRPAEETGYQITASELDNEPECQTSPAVGLAKESLRPTSAAVQDRK